MLLHTWVCFDIMDEQEAKVGGFEHHRGRIHFSEYGLLEVVWLRKLFSELFGHVLDTIVTLCDNQSGIRLFENPMFHDRSKHIDIRYHFIWDMVQRGAVRLDHIGTDEQVKDILTKPLGKVKFLRFSESLGIVE